MTEPTATMEETATTGEYTDDYEMSTNRLASGTLQKTATPSYSVNDWDMVPDSEWLLRITSGLNTAELEDDPFTPEQRSRFGALKAQARAGMASHASGVKIVPTKGARFTTGLRRGVLLTLLSALGITLIAGAGYLLAETAWLSNLFAPAAPAITPPVQEPSSQQPTNQTQVEQPAPVLPEVNDSRPPAPSANNSQPATDSPAVPADIQESALAGTDALVLRDRGVDAYKAGNYAQAVDLLEQSVALNKDDAVAQFQLGMAYMSVTGRNHSLDDAELAFRTAVSLQPGWAAAHQMLAESFLRRNYFKEAIPFAQQATQIDPTMAEAWLTLGRAYQGAGMDAEAQQAYAEAAKFAPKP